MRVALTGVSHWHTRFYLDPLLAMPQVKIVGVSDPGAAGAVADAAGCPAFADVDELCDRTRPDFVFALGRHCDMAGDARTLIRRRIPFAMEKPCGLNAAPGGRPRGTRAADAELFVAVPLVFRQGRMRETVERVAAGERLFYLSFRFVAGGVERYRDAGCSWMLHRKAAGGGCLLNLGVHFFDLFRVMAAPAEPVVVAASMSNAVAGLDVEDHAVVVLRAGAAKCAVETGYFFPAPTDRFDMRFSIRTERHHFIAPDRDTLEIFDADGRMVEESMPTTNVPYYAGFVRDALGRVVAGEPPVAGLADMAASLRLIEHAYAMAPLPGRPASTGKGLLLADDRYRPGARGRTEPLRMTRSIFQNGWPVLAFSTGAALPSCRALRNTWRSTTLKARRCWTARRSLKNRRAHSLDRAPCGKLRVPIVRNVYVEIRAPVTSGPQKTGDGLLLVAIDVDPRHDAELNRWYDDEHIAERMTIPGFLRARRFMALEGGPRYLARVRSPRSPAGAGQRGLSTSRRRGSVAVDASDADAVRSDDPQRLPGNPPPGARPVTDAQILVENVLNALAAGIVIGGMYGLMCVGLGLIFGVMKVINFAQGELLMLGMYVTVYLFGSLGLGALLGAYVGPYAAALLAGPVLFAGGALLHRGLISRVSGLKTVGSLDEGHFGQLIVTLGVSLILQNGGLILFGSTPCRHAHAAVVARLADRTDHRRTPRSFSTRRARLPA